MAKDSLARSADPVRRKANVHRGLSVLNVPSVLRVRSGPKAPNVHRDLLLTRARRQQQVVKAVVMERRGNAGASGAVVAVVVAVRAAAMVAAPEAPSSDRARSTFC